MRIKGFWIAKTTMGYIMNSGNIIMSRYEIHDANFHQYCNIGGWQRILPREIIHAKIKINNKDIHIFNTYLQANTIGGNSIFNFNTQKIRRRQIVEAKTFMDKYICNDKWLLGGDFNISGPSIDYNYLKSKMTTNSLLENVCFPPTYNLASFLALKWSIDKHSLCIDHIFTNMDTTCIKVLSDDLSDHYPITCSLLNL